MGYLTRITNLHPLRRLDPDRRARVGFAAGSVVAILVAVGVLVTIHATKAEPFTTADDSTAAPASGGQDSGTFGGTSEAPAPQPSPSGTYAALGDSVAAGLGLASVTNPTAEDSTCGRSSQAYAFEVGRQLNHQVKLVACSGATAGDLLTQQHVDGTNPQAQLTTAYAGGAPSLISITAGANDTAWSTFVKKCYTMECGGNGDQRTVDAALVLVRAKLTAALASIQLRAANSGSQPPRVVLTGYYDPFSAQCLQAPGVADKLTPSELAWLESNVSSLNQTISQVAGNYSFARFAPVDFSGHDICSADPWVQGLADAAPVHPTAAGQQAIAGSVVKAAR